MSLKGLEGLPKDVKIRTEDMITQPQASDLTRQRIQNAKRDSAAEFEDGVEVLDLPGQEAIFVTKTDAQRAEEHDNWLNFLTPKVEQSLFGDSNNVEIKFNNIDVSMPAVDVKAESESLYFSEQGSSITFNKTEVTESRTEEKVISVAEKPANLADSKAEISDSMASSGDKVDAFGLFKSVFSEGFKIVTFKLSFKEITNAFSETFKIMTGKGEKKSKPLSPEEQQKKQKKDQENAIINANKQTFKAAEMDAKMADRDKKENLKQRLNLAGMSKDQIINFMGKTANVSSQNLDSEANLHAAAQAMVDASKNQEKRQKQAESQSIQGPKVNISAAAEGGTGKGGVANISAQAGG